jgi:hypothetical protein
LNSRVISTQHRSPQTVENRNGVVSCSVRLFSHIDTLNQPDEAGKEGEMTRDISFIHPHPARDTDVE